MANFGQLDFSVSLKPTSAFPLDARCYFTTIEDARTAARQAKSVGSTDSIYHYGELLMVHNTETNNVSWFMINQNNTLTKMLFDFDIPEDFSIFVEKSYVDSEIQEVNARIDGLEVGGVDVTDSMTQGDMRPITSNAVYNVVGNIRTLLSEI